MYKRNENIVLRQTGDTYFLVDITDNYLDSTCTLYETNEIGAFVWNVLEKNSKLDDIVQRLIEVIIDDVNYEDVYEDIKEYLRILVNEKFVEEI